MNVLVLTQMASAMLSVRAFWTSQLRIWCSELSSTSHLLRLDAVSVYRQLVCPAHRTLCSWRGNRIRHLLIVSQSITGLCLWARFVSC